MFGKKKELKESSYKEYLKAAIDGESTAVAKYREFQQVAENKGFKNIAYLFKALVAAERIHIKNHTRALREEHNANISMFEVGTPLENVNAAIKGELYETREMYPNFIKALKKVKQTTETRVAALSMAWAGKVEKTHAEVLNLALSALKQNKDLDVEEIYVCKACGNLILEKPSKPCPVCGHDPSFYLKVPRGGSE